MATCKVLDLSMAESQEGIDPNETTEWVRPVSTGANMGKVPVNKVIDAYQKHGVRIDKRPDGKFDVEQVAVTDIPTHGALWRLFHPRG